MKMNSVSYSAFIMVFFAVTVNAVTMSSLSAQPPARMKPNGLPAERSRKSRFHEHIAAATRHLKSGDLERAEKSLVAAEKAATRNEAVMVAVLRSDLLSQQGEFGAAIEVLRRILKEVPRRGPDDLLGATNQLAWLLAVSPTEDLRNGREAKELATAAYAKYKRYEILDTLAAAHADCGEFDLAIKYQERVVKAARKKDKRLEEYQKRLKLYQSGRPFRMPEKTLRDLF